MQIMIKDDRVYQNILIFLELMVLLKQDALNEKLRAKVSIAFLNRMSGEIYFRDLLPDSHALNEKDWKVIELCYTPDPVDQHLQVDIQEQGETRAFQYEDLSPLALRVVSETMKTWNNITAQEQEPLEIIAPQVDLIQATWHDADRWEAESILEKHPYGSFLFRRDEYASILAHQLQEQLKRNIICYTLSFIEPRLKISDLTIVHDSGRWLIYNDDPNLAGTSYKDIESLLNGLKNRCRIPVYSTHIP